MKKISQFLKFYCVGILISLAFFIIGILTLSNYGINIDEPIHFERGNAYLDLFLTGREKYTAQDFMHPRTSEWKYRGYDTAYFLKNDSGHPSLNGILAAATNRIFYEKFGIMGDLESYHLFELFVSSILIFMVFAMINNRYGLFAGTIASLSVVLYPLFYGESHFNIKDPVEASFFALTLYFFYLGVNRIKGKYIFISSIFCALAFGTKFNILFIVFMAIPYLLIRYGYFFKSAKKLEKLKKIPKSIYIALILYPLIVIGLHFLSRPFLWADPFNRFMQIAQYYKDIGTGIDYQSIFIKYGINTYPSFFVGISTPLVILTLFIIGTLVALLKIRSEKDKFSLLLLLWFGVTLLRVSLPGTSIYGGVRQIMEYIPAMAALSGIGALFLRNTLSRYIGLRIASLIILALFLPLSMTLIRLHPNENLFMNSLVGGLKGATEKKIPGVGETMGNAYLQGILWLNDNAEKGARFGFPVGLGSNFPPQFVRKDIKFGGHFSGMGRGGEYMMEMISVEYPPPRYNFQYLNTFLNSVYEAKVDDVVILKIWKNDEKHTKKGFLEEAQEEDISFKLDKEKNTIAIQLEKPFFITMIEIIHKNNNCVEEGSGVISYSPDGKKEFVAPDDLYRSQGRYAYSLQTKTRFVYFFAASKAKEIFISPYDQNSCLLQAENVKVSRLKNILP